MVRFENLRGEILMINESDGVDSGYLHCNRRSRSDARFSGAPTMVPQRHPPMLGNVREKTREKKNVEEGRF
jgi:hypothetical protein